MKSILAIGIALLALTSHTAHAASPATKDVSALLNPIIQKHGVLGMVAAVVRNGEIVALSAVGVRTRGGIDKIAASNHIHIGSDAKAMTAMLCGVLVEEGRLDGTRLSARPFPS